MRVYFGDSHSAYDKHKTTSSTTTLLRYEQTHSD